MKKIFTTAVILIAAVVLLLTLKIETPSQHDKRVQSENTIVILTPTVEPDISAHAVATPEEVTTLPGGVSGSPAITREEEGVTPTKEVVTKVPTKGGEETVFTPTIAPTKTPTPMASGEETGNVPTEAVTNTPAPTATSTLTSSPTLTNTPKPTKTPTPTEGPAEAIMLTFTITCEKVKPEAGLIFSGTVQAMSNNTVLDVLEGVCAAAGIQCGVNRGTTYGAYVYSIGNVAEKEYGKYSGWMYSVNGKNPPMACDKLKVKQGDEIVWFYKGET